MQLFKMLKNKEVNDKLKLVLIKVSAVLAVFACYTYSFTIFLNQFAVIHSVNQFGMNVFKSGFSYSALYGVDSIKYNKLDYIIRYALSFFILLTLYAWYTKSTPNLIFIVPVLGAVWGWLYLRHVKGNIWYSFLLSFFPIVVIFCSILVFIGGGFKYGVNLELWVAFFGLFSLIAALAMLIFGKGQKELYFYEVVHMALTPLVLLALSSRNLVDDGGYELYLLKIFDLMSQVLVFVITSKFNRELMLRFAASKLAFIFFIFMLLVSCANAYFENIYLVLLVVGTLSLYLNFFSILISEKNKLPHAFVNVAVVFSVFFLPPFIFVFVLSFLIFVLSFLLYFNSQKTLVVSSISAG